MSPPTADPAVLLVHADFVRSLARSLLADPHRADDAAQETWVRAVERPPRTGASPRGWLQAVLKSRVRDGRRRALAREARERKAAVGEAVPSAAAIAEREAVRRRVVDAVLALDEPYRQVVLLRTYEDLPPREIAKRLGVPVETVRTRWKRGLERLRKRLDAEHDGDRSAWATVLAPFAAGESARAGVLAAAAALLTLPGAFTVSLALLVALIVLGGWWWSARGGNEGSPAVANSIPEGPNGAVGANAPSADAAALPIEASPRDTAQRAVAETDAPRLAGIVVDEATGAPRAEAEVVLAGTSGAPDDHARAPGSIVHRSTRADAAGRFAFATLPEGTYVLLARSTDGRATSRPHAVFLGDAWAAAAAATRPSERGPAGVVRAGDDAPAEARLELLPAARVEGRVLDSAGRPLRGATVVAFPDEPSEGIAAWLRRFGPLVRRASSAEDGRFALDALLGDVALAATAEGSYAVRATQRLEPGTTHTQDLVLTERARRTLAGSVLSAEGRPLPGATVVLRPARPAAEFDDAVFPRATTAAAGRFALERVAALGDAEWTLAPAPDEELVVIAEAEGHLTGRSAPFPFAGAPPEIACVLQANRRVEGVVLDAGTGLPVPGATVVLGLGMDVLATAKSAADGRFSLEGAPAAGAVLTVRAPGYAVSRGALDAAGDGVVRLVRSEWTVRGTVVDPSGAPLPHLASARVGDEVVSEVAFDVLALRDDPGEAVDRGTPLPDLLFAHAGRMVTASRTDEGFALVVPPAWEATEAWLVLLVAGEVAELRRVTPGDGPARFIADPAEVLARRSVVTVRVLGRDGLPVRSPSVRVFPRGTSEPIDVLVTTDRDGARLVLRRPGTYDLVVSADGYGAAVLERLEVAPGVALGPLEARLVAEARIEGTVAGATSESTVLVFDGGHRLLRVIATEDGAFAVRGLAPGRHLVRVCDSLLGFDERAVDVQAGAAAHVALVPDRRHEVVLDPTGWTIPARTRVAVRLTDRFGRPTTSGRSFLQVPLLGHARHPIGVGEWTVRISTGTQVVFTRTFTVEREGTTVVRLADAR